MPEYEQMVDKYLAMGYDLSKAEEYATEDWNQNEESYSYKSAHYQE
jgi:hypothetical protein